MASNAEAVTNPEKTAETVGKFTDVEAVVPTTEEPLEKAGNAALKKDVWPLWKLCLLALPQLGVQVLWGFIGPNSVEYMRHLGAPDALATLNNIAGPIAGFFTGPLVGAWSDSSTSRWGRRRPIILGGLISTLVAGFFWAGSEALLPKKYAIWLSAPMYWVLDITINVLQTPFRALVSDYASEEQQAPMQVWFVFMIAIGNFIAYSMMTIYAAPTEHMLELMMMICGINVVCIAITACVAKETPLVRTAEREKECCCAPVFKSLGSLRGVPPVFYRLLAVHCLVWLGNTTWGAYGQQWFTANVFEGDVNAEKGSAAQIAYKEGVDAFGTAGQYRSGVQLVVSLLMMFIMLKTSIPHRLVYMPCLYIGAVVALLAAFAVGHSGNFAIVCMALSMIPESASLAIPYGLVAFWNKKAEEEGKEVSTAMQMAVLNCCITIGQVLCTSSLALLETGLSLERSLTIILIVGGTASALAGTGAYFLKSGDTE
mmetsp:Transcript_22146/g.39800  ORF Transcript_22146/g.39800 Transcript_22146/m.39800 type:complete len:485 (+) Transcript_22146:74-1528(+)|eukprot:CAMPEP_0197651268 /NCGR_PEP_ID=MMETSP1338-20131121/31754_1 /TAXON_ID=43686 ORGANISM="Pelagodinium beii, Strain RCC1491" /NCGR_SAMPLE_ID=MMETSP1338 /ASSEMBLY_ACC=CAM_ASM_000754 /LENGTH=484 /DNA_ID=CAMNT_0043225855 /DNA_START=56 /DNA_END=1510 /DNA_ORIENTATION=+